LASKVRTSSGAYVLSHPVRRAVIEVLQRKDRAYIAQIANELGLSARLVTFHLSILSTSGFVESEYGLSNPRETPPRAVRYYQVTPKVDKVLNEFVASLGK